MTWRAISTYESLAEISPRFHPRDINTQEIFCLVEARLEAATYGEHRHLFSVVSLLAVRVKANFRENYKKYSYVEVGRRDTRGL